VTAIPVTASADVASFLDIGAHVPELGAQCFGPEVGVGASGYCLVVCPTPAVPPGCWACPSPPPPSAHPAPQITELTSRLSASSGTASVSDEDAGEEAGLGVGRTEGAPPAGAGAGAALAVVAPLPTASARGLATPASEDPSSARSSLDSYDSVGSCVRDFEMDLQGEQGPGVPAGHPTPPPSPPPLTTPRPHPFTPIHCGYPPMHRLPQTPPRSHPPCLPAPSSNSGAQQPLVWTPVLWFVPCPAHPVRNACCVFARAPWQVGVTWDHCCDCVRAAYVGPPGHSS
jgi:hypothetical protein